MEEQLEKDFWEWWDKFMGGHCRSDSAYHLCVRNAYESAWRKGWEAREAAE